MAHSDYQSRSFLVGSLIFGQLAHRVKTRRRGWLIMTTFFQATLLLAAALVEQSGIPGQSTGPRALAIVGLLSFSQAGQVSLAIGVGLAEVNTTMITGALVSFLPTLSKQHIEFLLTYTPRSPRSATQKSSNDQTTPGTAASSSSSSTSSAVSPERA